MASMFPVRQDGDLLLSSFARGFQLTETLLLSDRRHQVTDGAKLIRQHPAGHIVILLFIHPEQLPVKQTHNPVVVFEKRVQTLSST